jgi:hypothetical protein
MPDNGFRSAHVDFTFSKNPASSETPPNDYEVAATTVYQSATIRIPAGHLAAGAAIDVPVNLLPNLSGLPDYPGVIVEGATIVIPALRDEWFQAHWWNDRYLAVGCTTVTANAYYRTPGASGDDFYLADPNAPAIDMGFPSFEVSSVTFANENLCY